MKLFNNSSPKENYEFDDPVGGEEGITLDDAEPAERGD